MRILWVKVGGLWPCNTGGRVRSFNIIGELARHHEVTVLTTREPAEDPAALARALPQCRRVASFPHVAPKWSSPAFAATLARSWFSELPVDLLKHRVPALRAEVARLLTEEPFDLCVADFLFAIPNIPDRAPKARGGPLDGRVPVVLFAHNVEHMIWQRLCRADRSLWRRPLLEIEWRKLRRYEAAACRRADATIAVSEPDRDVLAANAPGAQVRAIPTGVDTTYFRPNGTAARPAQLVFTGSMDWRPNDDAMLWFIDAILPGVRARVPEAGLTVVGRNPGEPLREAARRAGVEVTGTVDDVRGYVERGAVYVVPLRIGGGTRIKIFEALAMGKPVVSTAVGAEGLPLEDGVHFVRADDPARFADAVVALLRDPARGRALGQAGRRLVADHYGWPRVAQEFAQQCAQVLQ